MLKLDHIALGANDLEKSCETLSQQLGVLPFGGGEHELFGTHNKLWRIETADYPVYLELIAANPKAEPKRARWFGLEKPFLSEDIQLLGFIASTQNIDGLVQKPPFDLLDVIDVTRGVLNWRFGITKDGALLDDGALPYLIEWQGGRHPLDGVAPQHIELKSMAGKALDGLDLNWPCMLARGGAQALSVELIAANGETLRFKRA
ncbi:VOC family protein [uncultured Maritalea sp.]|jgi:hypothetical protein|uniref:VOC family protein n=1 Tax=uncultured Maritalea sp. TaxID=757249 RepID=UPI00260A32D1|nr:VOC family protein [uncultured Maritalea sp.]